jgi:hypothetical protein
MGDVDAVRLAIGGHMIATWYDEDGSRTALFNGAANGIDGCGIKEQIVLRIVEWFAAALVFVLVENRRRRGIFEGKDMVRIICRSACPNG